jgi:DNA-binding MarR family transcriptional regulator
MLSPSPVPGPNRLAKQDYERLSQFRYRLRQFLRASETMCRRHGLTLLQYQLLLHIMGFEGRDWASIGELAERLQAHHHGVVALVDRCEELMLLQRRPGREDQRIVEIHLRPKGKQLLAQLAALHKEERRALLRELAAVDAPIAAGARPGRARAARPDGPQRSSGSVSAGSTADASDE